MFQGQRKCDPRLRNSNQTGPPAPANRPLDRCANTLYRLVAWSKRKRSQIPLAFSGIPSSPHSHILENSTVELPYVSRRTFSLGLTLIPNALLFAATGSTAKHPTVADGLTHTSEAIRQQLMFDASPQRIYQALTSTRDFDKITRLSDGALLLNAAGAKPTAISAELGGPFTLFGGYITGRQLEMMPNELLVQAWREESWKPGAFSIAAFYLTAEGGKTRLNFEHRGFPNGNGVSLAQGWHSHYWEPLAKLLVQG
jgi:Activator of Hsp90 ATPase homolog 1-like protein